MAIIGISLFEKVKLLSLFVNELACLIHIQAKAGVDEPHHYVLSLTILLSPTPLYFPFTSLRQFLRRNEDSTNCLYGHGVVFFPATTFSPDTHGPTPHFLWYK